MKKLLFCPIGFYDYDDMIEKGKSYGLTEVFIRAMFNAIHDASVAEQNKILEQ